MKIAANSLVFLRYESSLIVIGAGLRRARFSQEIWESSLSSEKKNTGVASKESSNIMKRYFTRNIETKGRIVRSLVAVVLLSTAIVSFQFSVFLGLVLLVSGSFILFEAHRAWCALRACGIKTKI